MDFLDKNPRNKSRTGGIARSVKALGAKLDSQFSEPT